MKKMKIMALALVSAVALTGAGYAAWSNTITAKTAINTGDWNVVLENDASASYLAGDRVNTFKRGELETSGTAYYGNHDGTGYDNNAAAENTGNANYVYTLAPTPEDNDGKLGCKFAFENLHPGTEVMTRFEVRNRGTIPAKIEAVHVTFWNDGNQITDLSDNNTSKEWQVIKAMKVDPFFQIHRGSGDASSEIPVINTTNVELKCLESTLNDAMKGLVLKPTDNILSDELEAGGGETELNPVFTFKLPADSLKANPCDLNSANLGMDANFKVKITFDFVQYNDVTHSDNTAVTQ